jgi:hypothetical protein
MKDKEKAVKKFEYVYTMFTPKTKSATHISVTG